jgi:phospholipase/carboxylesterase
MGEQTEVIARSRCCIMVGRTTLRLNVINIPAETEAAPAGLVVALHGWGANAFDLTSLVPLLNLPNYEFIFPDAPFPHPQVPGGKMWYDFQDGQGMTDSRQLLLDWLHSLEPDRGIPLSRTILGGFSQGAAMSLEVGLTLPIAGLIALSGYLHPLPPKLPNRLPPILMVHGTQDVVVPVGAARSARDELQAIGAVVDYHELAMGHEICQEVVHLMEQFIVKVMSPFNGNP